MISTGKQPPQSSAPLVLAVTPSPNDEISAEIQELVTRRNRDSWSDIRSERDLVALYDAFARNAGPSFRDGLQLIKVVAENTSDPLDLDLAARIGQRYRFLTEKAPELESLTDWVLGQKYEDRQQYQTLNDINDLLQSDSLRSFVQHYSQLCLAAPCAVVRDLDLALRGLSHVTSRTFVEQLAEHLVPLGEAAPAVCKSLTELAKGYGESLSHKLISEYLSMFSSLSMFERSILLSPSSISNVALYLGALKSKVLGKSTQAATPKKLTNPITPEEYKTTLIGLHMLLNADKNGEHFFDSIYPIVGLTIEGKKSSGNPLSLEHYDALCSIAASQGLDDEHFWLVYECSLLNGGTLSPEEIREIGALSLHYSGYQHKDLFTSRGRKIFREFSERHPQFSLKDRLQAALEFTVDNFVSGLRSLKISE